MGETKDKKKGRRVSSGECPAQKKPAITRTLTEKRAIKKMQGKQNDLIRSEANRVGVDPNVPLST